MIMSSWRWYVMCLFHRACQAGCESCGINLSQIFYIWYDVNYICICHNEINDGIRFRNIIIRCRCGALEHVLMPWTSKNFINIVWKILLVIFFNSACPSMCHLLSQVRMIISNIQKVVYWEKKLNLAWYGPTYWRYW